MGNQPTSGHAISGNLDNVDVAAVVDVPPAQTVAVVLQTGMSCLKPHLFLFAGFAFVLSLGDQEGS
jgi:hypothetical protein